jgi:hypothetical protein
MFILDKPLPNKCARFALLPLLYFSYELFLGELLEFGVRGALEFPANGEVDVSACVLLEFFDSS